MSLLWPVVVAFGLSSLLCALVVWAGPKDAPDGKRKMQVRAVPTSGGAAILTAFTIVFCAGLFCSGLETSFVLSRILAWGWGPHLALIGGAALIGLVDDLTGLGPRLKMAFLIALSLFAAAFGFNAVPFGGDALPGAHHAFVFMGVAGSALWLFVIMNAVNFMDGCNGLIGGVLSVVFLALGALILLMSFWGGGVAPVLFPTTLGLVAAVAGFLVWNVFGRLYLGDSGALGLGAAFGSLSLFLGHYVREEGGPVSGDYVWLAATLALPLLVDVFMTLIWRAQRGANILHAHREHAYQLFMRAGWPHLAVAGLWSVFAGICGVFGLAAMVMDPLPVAGVFLALLLIGIGLWLVQRRTYWPRLSTLG